MGWHNGCSMVQGQRRVPWATGAWDGAVQRANAPEPVRRSASCPQRHALVSGCQDDQGYFHAVGDSWSPSPCEGCTCTATGPQCYIMDCAPPACENYYVPEGECCPRCPGMAVGHAVVHPPCPLAEGFLSIWRVLGSILWTTRGTAFRGNPKCRWVGPRPFGPRSTPRCGVTGWSPSIHAKCRQDLIWRFLGYCLLTTVMSAVGQKDGVTRKHKTPQPSPRNPNPFLLTCVGSLPFFPISPHHAPPDLICLMLAHVCRGMVTVCGFQV